MERMSLNKPTSPHLSDVGAASSSTSPNNLVAASAGMKNFPSSDNIGSMLTHSSRSSTDSRSKQHLSTATRTYQQQTPQLQQHQSQDNRSVGSLRHNSTGVVSISINSNRHRSYIDFVVQVLINICNIMRNPKKIFKLMRKRLGLNLNGTCKTFNLLSIGQ